MAPGPLTSAARSGDYRYSFSRSQAFAPRTAGLSRHAFEAPAGRRSDMPFTRDRDFGQRNRFAVTGNGNGGHEVTLADNEAATLTVAEDGSLTIEIQDKPAEAEAGGGNGSNGGTNDAATTVQTEPVPRAQRTFTGQRQRMSWERDPASGGVMFTPGADEVLEVDGDAIQAIVSAHPSPAMPNG